MNKTVRRWNAKFDERGDITAFEPVGSQRGSVAESLASGPESAAQSLAPASSQSPPPVQETTETPRDSGFNQPTQSLVQEVAAMTQVERLARAKEARGSLVKVWRTKALKDGKGRDFRGVISSDCMNGMEDLMKARKIDLKRGR